MSACTIALFLISALAGLIYLYLSWNFNYWKKRGVTGPEPKLIFGSIPCVVKRNRNLAFDMKELYEKYKKSGERFIGIFMTRNPQILVIDPSVAREVLITNFKSFRINETTQWVNHKEEEVATRNPFMTTEAQWKTKRSEVVAGLSSSRLKLAHPIVMDICKKLVNHVKALNEQSSGKSIEAKNLCRKFTIEIIADFVWGVTADAFTLDDSPNQMMNMSEIMLNKSFLKTGFYYISGLAPIIRKFVGGTFYPKETDQFFTRVQKDALEMRYRNPNDRPDFLNYLIQLQEKKNLNHMDLVGHSMTVLLDGFETAASVMSHTLYFLAGNENVQKKLREEIQASVDGYGNLSYDELVELPYLDQCVNETIRIITLISVYSRICSDATYLENREGHKVKIEPGMIVNISSYAFHNDPDVFPNPDKYIPERFDDGRAKEFNQQGYFIPFGDGPRICAGMKLGQLEAKAGIVEIVKNFNLSLAEKCEQKIDPTSFLLGIAGDILVKFEAIH